jgi:hypothetical protein
MLINVSKGETNTSKWRSSLIHGTAGFIGNMVSGIFYPLELLKLRMQGNFLFIQSKKNTPS